MSSFRCVLALVLSVPGICWSQDLLPGLWQISVQARSAAMPADMAPMQVSRCLTQEDAKDPSKFLGGIASPGASECVYTDKSYSGNTFRFAMECAGTLALKASGEVAYTSSSLSGTINSTASVGGQPIEMSNAVSARRVGDCSPSR